MMIGIKKEATGIVVSLFKRGLPRSVVLNEKTPKKVLQFLLDSGSNLVEEIKENGSDNKK